MRMTVVIPSRNEGAWLARTVQSIRENEPGDVEIIHVDDASERPEPDLSAWDVKEVKLPKRHGAAVARAIGLIEARPDSDVLGTVDSHMLFGAGDALAALVEENQRFITRGALLRDYTAPVWECQVSAEPHKLTRLGEMVLKHDCLGYMSPCRQGVGTAQWRNKLLRVSYFGARGPKLPEVVFSAALNGGCYFGSRHAWETIGGYPQLPGHFGFEEEALAFICAGYRMPILCATQMSPWHVFRSQGIDPIPCPYTTAEDKQLENLAGVYRLAFDADYWTKHWRPTLMTEKLPGRNFSIPPYVFTAVENETFSAYADSVQAGFCVHGTDLLAELAARQEADLKLLDLMKEG